MSYSQQKTKNVDTYFALLGGGGGGDIVFFSSNCTGLPLEYSLINIRVSKMYGKVCQDILQIDTKKKCIIISS